MNKEITVNNADGMSLQNQIAILQLLQRAGCLTRTHLADNTGLTQAAVSKITAQLIAAGVIEETGLLTGRKGRRSIGLGIVDGGCKVIGVKLSRRNYAVGVFSLSGQLLEKVKGELSPGTDSKQMMVDIRKAVLGFLDKYQEIAALGAAVPGPYLMKEKRILLISELDMQARRDIDLSTLFKGKAFEKLPIVFSHDANAGAMADWWFDIEDRKFSGSIVHFLVGEGVGAGVVSNGIVFAGAKGTAAEIGHVSIDHQGPTCVCGNRGCLEMYCSSLAFVQQAEEKRKTHPGSLLNEMENLTPEAIFDSALRGDSLAIQCVKDVAYYIALGCVNIINCYNPNTILICNDMAQGGDMLLDEVKQVVRQRVIPFLYEHVDIHFSRFRGDDILFGAAAVAIDYCLKHPNTLGDPRQSERRNDP